MVLFPLMPDAAAAAAMLTATVFPANMALTQARARLHGLVRRQARRMERIAAHKPSQGHHMPDTSGHCPQREAILKQVAGAHVLVTGADRTCEFRPGERSLAGCEKALPDEAVQIGIVAPFGTRAVPAVHA
jgi:hypothetical protein